MKKLDLYSSEMRAVKRLFLYFIALSFISTVAVFLVYAVRGYDIDPTTGEVIQNGLVLIESQPESAQLFVNGGDENDGTPSKIALPAGSYRVSLRNDLYHDWTKSVNVTGSGVNWINYPFLFKREIDKTPVATIGSQRGHLLSQDEKYIIVQANSLNYTVYEIDDLTKPPRSVVIDKLAFVENESESMGLVELVDTSFDGDWLLLRHEKGSKIDYVLVPWKNPEDYHNISRDSELTITDLLPIDARALEFYLTDNKGNLYRYHREDETAKPIEVDGELLALANSGDRLAMVVRSEVNGTVMEISDNDGQSYDIVRAFPAGIERFALDITEYDRKAFTSVLFDDTAFVYEDPFADHTRTALKVFSVGPEAELSVSENNRFIAFIDGPDFVVYDYDLDESYRFRININFGQFTWISGFHLGGIDSKGVLRVVEFDNQNLVEVMTNQAGSTAYFSQSMKDLAILEAGQNNRLRLGHINLDVE